MKKKDLQKKEFIWECIFNVGKIIFVYYRIGCLLMFKRKRIRTIEVVPENLKDFFKNSVVNYYDSLVLKKYDEKSEAINEFIKSKGSSQLSREEILRIQFVHRFNYADYTRCSDAENDIFSAKFYVELFKSLQDNEIHILEELFKYIFNEREYLWYLFLFFIIIHARKIIILLFEFFKNKDKTIKVLKMFPNIDGYLPFASNNYRVASSNQMRNSFFVDYDFILYQILNKLQDCDAKEYFGKENGEHSNDYTYNDYDLVKQPHCFTVSTHKISNYLVYLASQSDQPLKILDEYNKYYEDWIGNSRHQTYSDCKGFYSFMNNKSRLSKGKKRRTRVKNKTRRKNKKRKTQKLKQRKN